MGNASSVLINYAVPYLEPGRPPSGDSTPAYRAATHPDELVESLHGVSINNCWDMFQLGRKEKGDGQCLGSRVLGSDGQLGPFVWKSYHEIDLLARQVGSGLDRLGCLPTLKFPDEKNPYAKEVRMIGLYFKNREEWFLTELAGGAYNFTIVPLYDTLGPQALQFVLGQTEMRACICQGDVIDTLLNVIEGTKLETIISVDPVSDETKARIVDRGIRLLLWQEIVEKGKEPLPPSPGGLDSINTICYTSGTTGNPKGVIITHRNLVSVACAIKRGPVVTKALDISKDDVHASYLPLAHVFERMVCQVCFLTGVGIGIYSGDTLKLIDDLKLMKPTVFISVPRLFNRVHDRVFGGISEKSAVQQYLFNSGLSAKVSSLRKSGRAVHPVWDKIVFNKTKSLMGGRLRYMIVGGAPLSPLVQERISALFCCPLLEGYGMTETMGASFFQHGADPVKGSVGGIVAALEFKLQSLPEMDYLVTDNPPKGELCIRGPGVTPGYFRNEEQTNAAFDSDGWLHTGDVSMLLPTGAVKIIDRAKNMFKLSQGEYVAPEKIEQVYQQAFLVAQVFCFGYSEKPMLVGVVVPDFEVAEKWAVKNGRPGASLTDLCETPAFHEAVAAEMEEVGKRAGLKGFEKIKAFKLHSEVFSIENDLLTPTFKLKRFRAAKVFEETIDNLYADLGA